MKGISAIILTFNSEAVIEATLLSAMKVAQDVHVVDSYSSDGTLDIARRLGANIVQHDFSNYSAQRNWAIDHLPLKGEWQLHLDADERLSDQLVEEIIELQPDEAINGYFIARQVVFLGRSIVHGGMYPIWHMRLFRTGKGRCEERLYDQHFVLVGKSVRLNSSFIDEHRNSLAEWTDRHNRWSDAEVAEIISASETKGIKGRFSGDPIERKRAIKGWYYRFPLFWRAFFLFFYRYVLRFGFLDGFEGLIFYVLQSLWFRFLIDAKYFEKKHELDRS